MLQKYCSFFMLTNGPIKWTIGKMLPINCNYMICFSKAEGTFVYVYVYVRRVQMQKPLSAVWIFLLKFVFFSHFYIYVQLFHFNCIENDLYIAIKVKLLERFKVILSIIQK